MSTEPILAETILGIQHTLGAELDRIAIERAVIGLFFTCNAFIQFGLVAAIQ
jgi:hypothetical protein